MSLLASLATAALLSSLAFAGSALATEPYGEVAHFGGFDGSGSVLGKFKIPVGFAVDPSDSSTSDGNAVYVLDQTLVHAEEEEPGELAYRLQKLSSTGTVLGSAKLPTESFNTENETYTEAHPLISLAVDSAQHRVYALVEGMVGVSGAYLPVADELVAWSTIPSGSKGLEKAPVYPEDSITHAGLVANLLQSEPSKDLYAPEGITVDPKTHNVVIEAQDGVTTGIIGGPTMLQPVVTEGPKTGELGKAWVADTAKTAPTEEAGDGLFTATNGESFGVDLYVGAGSISRLADVKSNFAAPEPSSIAEDTSGGINKDQAPTIDNQYTVNYRFGHTGGKQRAGAFAPYTAGTPITQLTNNLYAARYGEYSQSEVPLDSQAAIAPWNIPSPLRSFWTQAVSVNKGVAMEGIRLFEGDGKVVTTIGGQAVGHECNLDSGRLALAAGANGSVFVLSQPNAENGNSDDEVIVFAPGGSGKCPTPSGEVEVNGTKTLSASVTQKKSVKFDAISIERAGETPYAFEWYFEGTAVPASKTYVLVSKIEGPNYTWPNPAVEHTYQKAGTYEASVRLTGDYGTSVFPVQIKVEPEKPAVAKFTVPGSIVAGTAATFDASGSEPTPESAIVNYHWEFGDGSSAENTATAKKPHTFASAGEYKVKLKITDESGATAESESKVTVAAATKPSEEEHTHTGTTSTTPTSTSSTPPPPPPGNTVTGVTPGSVSKPLTKAQKLAIALKACKKIKSKHKRESCEKQAKAKYGTKAKAKKKSAKKK